jgi:hypothetical protein
MINKIKLLFCADDYTSFQNPHLIPLVEQYFDYGIYDNNAVYDKNCLVVVNVFYPMHSRTQIINRGIPMAVDNLWEVPQSTDGTFLQLTNARWFWYNESLWYRFNDFHNYCPNRTYDKLAFMPINRVANNRDRIVATLDPWLNKFIYSYKDQQLPGDIDKNIPSWQRHFNPDWYNRTCFSLVVESQLTGQGFVTEKTFKPIAFQHPFMVMGQTGTLDLLHAWGFESFDHLFDESYDKLEDHARLKKIIDNIDRYDNVPYNSVTLEKIKHNWARFFDQQLVELKIKQEIFDPMIEYVRGQ